MIRVVYFKTHQREEFEEIKKCKIESFINVFCLCKFISSEGWIHHAIPVGMANDKTDIPHLLLGHPLLQIGPPNLKYQEVRLQATELVTNFNYFQSRPTLFFLETDTFPVVLLASAVYHERSPSSGSWSQSLKVVLVLFLVTPSRRSATERSTWSTINSRQFSSSTTLRSSRHRQSFTTYLVTEERLSSTYTVTKQTRKKTKKR